MTDDSQLPSEPNPPEQAPISPEPSKAVALVGLVVVVLILAGLLLLRAAYRRSGNQISTSPQTFSQTDPALSADLQQSDTNLAATDRELNAANQGLSDQMGDLSE